MTQPEYEQKRNELWYEYTAMLRRNCASRYVFDKIFDRAFALGKLQASCRQVKETILQEEIEKASVEYADKTAKQYEVCNSEFVQEIMIAFEQGANYALGKQEKDAEETKTDDCVTISLHVAVIPCQEEFYMGVDASHEAYMIDIPKSMVPSNLLAVINGECKNKLVTNIAIMK